MTKENIYYPDDNAFDRFYKRARYQANSFVAAQLGSKAADLLTTVPDFAYLICKLMLDPDVPSSRKLDLGLALLYVLSPLDLVPDSVPLLGKVTAGIPILAVEQVEEYVPYSGGGYHAGDLFALRVSGTSMINAGILDKDIVIVKKTPVAENGDIVVALIGDEATVKRIYREKDHIRLQPENDAFEPIIVKEVVVLGKVVSLLRNFG